MRILVDADGCPVKEIIVKVAKAHGIEVIMIADNSHVLGDGYSSIVIVDKGADSADFKLFNLLKGGDIVVTQDYGVAAMALGKSALPINQNGLRYTNENIDRLLLDRHICKKARRSGKRPTPMKKRTQEDNESFEREFLRLVEEGINS